MPCLERHDAGPGALGIVPWLLVIAFNSGRRGHPVNPVSFQNHQLGMSWMVFTCFWLIHALFFQLSLPHTAGTGWEMVRESGRTLLSNWHLGCGLKVLFDPLPLCPKMSRTGIGWNQSCNSIQLHSLSPVVSVNSWSTAGFRVREQWPGMVLGYTTSIPEAVA